MKNVSDKQKSSFWNGRMEFEKADLPLIHCLVWSHL